MKVFISLPMKGLSDTEIFDHQCEILKLVKKEKGEGARLLCSIFHEGSALKSLGKSLMLMAEADLVVFGKGWENARGCKIEHTAAYEYGKEVMYE